MIVFVCYVGLLLYAAYKDYKTYTISNSLNMGILLLSLFDIAKFPLHLLGAVIITVPFLYLGVKTNGLGGGDIKFIFANGCMLGGYANYTGVLIGFLLVSITILVRKIRKTYEGTRKVAFAPYLVAGYLIVLLGHLL